MVISLLKRLVRLSNYVLHKPSPPSSEIFLLRAANAAIAKDDFVEAAKNLKLLADSGSKNPNVYESYGYVLLNLKNYDTAKAILQLALKLAPYSADAYYMLGKVCVYLQEPDVAERAWASCYALTHELEALYCDYCLLLFSKGKMEQAKSLMRSGIEHYPENADFHFYQGNLNTELTDYEGAIASYQKSIALNPNAEHLLPNYANALKHTGNLALSIALAKQSVDLAPASAKILSNYIFTIQYSSAFSKEEKFAAHLDYAKKFEAPLLTYWGNYQNSLKPHRKIRIGYVSGDFRNHSLIFFIEPVLSNHDKSRFEIYGYYAYPVHDLVTLRIQSYFDQWVDCHGVPDDVLAERIRTDEIDILIDLSGHTGYNRLLTFARKPAPVQMTWLGYQATTGLSAIDYRITEEALDPLGKSENFHSEMLLRLPSSGTFSPYPESPTVNQLPALKSTVFTFACLNNPAKITDEAIALWSKILVKSPASRLMIGNAIPALVEKLTAQFALNGVSADRFVFQPKVGLLGYLALHHQIDLALDTFPYNGGTTTFHSLWMGVPILALEGDTALSKVGTSIMTGLGLSQFCCTTKQRYVDQAVALATQLPELAAVRLALRPQMAVVLEGLASSVTQNLENAFEKCWAEYREAQLEELANKKARQAALN